MICVNSQEVPHENNNSFNSLIIGSICDSFIFDIYIDDLMGVETIESGFQSTACCGVECVPQRQLYILYVHFDRWLNNII